MRRGGGITFGPHPRSYRQAMPKKMRQLALRCVLSTKVRDEELMILEKLELEEAKTKGMAKVLNALNAVSSVLLVGDGAEPEVIRAARNIPKVKTLPVNLLNTVDLVNARKVIITLEAVYKAEQLWGGDFVRKKVAAGDVVLDPESGEEESGGN